MNLKKNILVIGANGQLGMELRRLENINLAYNFLFVTRLELSIVDHAAVEKYFSQKKIDHCINCAAYTAVDKAETESEIAFQVNAAAVGNLAAVCKKHQTHFIHISTDYVFEGNVSVAYLESDIKNPQNVYGTSKLHGEITALENNDQIIIIRTSWIYSSYGKNFVKTMLRLMKEKDSIDVVNDQYGSPTYAADLAEAILIIISERQVWVPGIYHYSNEGIISWYDFALEIKKLTHSSCNINPIFSEAYPTPAKRPSYSVLDTTKIRETYNIHIPVWKDSLQKCILLLEK